MASIRSLFTDQWTIIKHRNTMSEISQLGRIPMQPKYSAVPFGGKLYITRVIDDSDREEEFRPNDFQIVFTVYDPSENTWQRLPSPAAYDNDRKYNVNCLKLINGILD